MEYLQMIHACRCDKVLDVVQRRVKVSLSCLCKFLTDNPSYEDGLGFKVYQLSKSSDDKDKSTATTYQLSQRSIALCMTTVKGEDSKKDDCKGDRLYYWTLTDVVSLLPKCYRLISNVYRDVDRADEDERVAKAEDEDDDHVREDLWVDEN